MDNVILYGNEQLIIIENWLLCIVPQQIGQMRNPLLIKSELNLY